MTRPKLFEPDAVLDKAVQAFWRNGYAATSTQVLVDCTGLGRGSIYHTFNSKAELFQAALRRYDTVQTARQEELLAGPGSLRERIRTLLTSVIEEETSADGPRGCLAVNSALELADQDPAVRELVRGVFERMRVALEAAIEAAQRTGEIAADRPASDVAVFVLNAMYGLRVLGKTFDRDALATAADMTVHAF